MYNEWPTPEPTVSWDDLQKKQGDGNDALSIEKTASFSSEVSRATQDTLFAGSGLLNEKLELRRHFDELMEDDDFAYVQMEKSLVSMGYQKGTVRGVFQEITGIDPVKAYLDTDNYRIPPGIVPRFNYAWGEAKEGKADFYFINPHMDQYGLFKTRGMEKELVESFYMLDDARKALKAKVKDFNDVTPDVTDTLSTILQKVASMAKLSPAGAKFLTDTSKLAERDGDTVARLAVMAVDEGKITAQDFQIIGEMLIEAAPPAPSMTAPERIDEKEFRQFRGDQEGRSFREMKNNTSLPGQEFASDWQSRNKIDFWGLLTESQELFDELASTLQGYKLEPSWGTFKVMPTPNLAVDEDNHILDGSIAVGATVQKMGSEEQSEIAVLFFIHNGKLQYSGKFKGINEREYGLTTIGLEAYFGDLSGSSAIDEQIERGVSNTPLPDNGMPGPMSSPI